MEIASQIEVCKVAPMSNFNIKSSSFPLTFLDITWLRFHPFQRLFFYELEPCNATITTFSTTIVPRLKHSLSLALQHYLPLAGNIVWDPLIDAPSIHYAEGDAATFIVSTTKSPDVFHHLSGRDNCVAIKDFLSFVPRLPSCDETRVAAISFQVTLFPGVGFSIGYTAHHAVMDGKGFALFMKSWGWICRLGGSNDMPREFIPCWDRSVVNNMANSNKNFVEWIKTIFGDKSMGVLPPTIEEPRHDVYRVTYNLTLEDIEKIKNSILEQTSSSRSSNITNFTSACAYIWSCIVKAEDIDENEDKNESIVIGIVVDSSRRLNPPLPSNYIGNYVTLCGAMETSTRLRTKQGLVFAANAMDKAIRDLSKGCLKVHEEWLRKLVTSGDDFKMYSISGSPRFEHYSVDFGWGRPIKTDVVSMYKTGDFVLTKSRDGDGGMEVSVFLKKHEMGKFSYLFRRGLRICSSL